MPAATTQPLTLHRVTGTTLYAALNGGPELPVPLEYDAVERRCLWHPDVALHYGGAPVIVAAIDAVDDEDSDALHAALYALEEAYYEGRRVEPVTFGALKEAA